jgi:hypothetical protein
MESGNNIFTQYYGWKASTNHATWLNQAQMGGKVKGKVGPVLTCD